MEPAFRLLPLHAATLRSITVDWANKLCTLVYKTVTGGINRIEFAGVRFIRIPMEDEWGPSEWILRQEQNGDVFRIEMQSGDNIEIVATNFIYD